MIARLGEWFGGWLALAAGAGAQALTWVALGSLIPWWAVFFPAWIFGTAIHSAVARRRQA